MKPKYSIITACKGRLEHLKEALPAMVAQDDAEVIVVDYSCPNGAAQFVIENYPSVKVVRVEGEEGFSNWRARNRGAQVAIGDFLIFCDADTVLAPDATAQLSKAVGKGQFGFFQFQATQKFNVPGERLSNNQLKGFHVVPTPAFRAAKGYDATMGGYAAGGDTDLEDRLLLRGLRSVGLKSAIIERVVEHDDSERVKFHPRPVGYSYAAGLFYRRAKQALMYLSKRPDIPAAAKTSIAAAAQAAAEKLMAEGGKRAQVNVVAINEPLRMPRQLGVSNGTFRITLKLEIVKGEPLDGAKEQARLAGERPDR